jgi:hypothetical protein
LTTWHSAGVNPFGTNSGGTGSGFGGCVAHAVTKIRAARMPEHLGWDHTTLVKVETGRRNISFVEARELARILETNLAGLDLAVEALESANYVVTSARRKKR